MTINRRTRKAFNKTFIRHYKEHVGVLETSAWRRQALEEYGKGIGLTSDEVDELAHEYFRSKDPFHDLKGGLAEWFIAAANEICARHGLTGMRAERLHKVVHQSEFLASERTFSSDQTKTILERQQEYLDSFRNEFGITDKVEIAAGTMGAYSLYLDRNAAMFAETGPDDNSPELNRLIHLAIHVVLARMNILERAND